MYCPTNQSIIVLIGVVIDNIEESKFINPLTGAHNPQPISQLLLLQEFLRPIPNQTIFLSAMCHLVVPALISKLRS